VPCQRHTGPKNPGPTFSVINGPCQTYPHQPTTQRSVLLDLGTGARCGPPRRRWTRRTREGSCPLTPRLISSRQWPPFPRLGSKTESGKPAISALIFRFYLRPLEWVCHVRRKSPMIWGLWALSLRSCHVRMCVNSECNTDGPSDQLDIVAGSRNMNSCFFLIMEKTFLVKNQHKIGWLGG
jgi:hypothetical protein